MSAKVGPLSKSQIVHLSKAVQQGASDASVAMAKWLNSPVTISMGSVDQCPLAQAANILGFEDAEISAVLMQMQGTLTGHMLLAFDDVSGLALSDLLTARAEGTATDWGEVEISSVLETMNIVGSAYLNGVARQLSELIERPFELIPSPPTFLHDFAESLLESACMDQAMAGSHVIFAKAQFQLSGQPLCWTFLLIPSPEAFEILSEQLMNLS